MLCWGSPRPCQIQGFTRGSQNSPYSCFHEKCKYYLLSSVWLFVTPWTIACQAPLSVEFSSKNTGVGSHSFLQRIFPTQGLNWVSCIAGRFFTIWATREAHGCGLFQKINSKISNGKRYVSDVKRNPNACFQVESLRTQFPQEQVMTTQVKCCQLERTLETQCPGFLLGDHHISLSANKYQNSRLSGQQVFITNHIICINGEAQWASLKLRWWKPSWNPSSQRPAKGKHSK